jgi:hypothetical protein
MGNPNCEKCKPDRPETHEQVVQDSGCKSSYQSVNECMKIHNGNVSDCNEEWASFRACFAKEKEKKTVNA